VFDFIHNSINFMLSQQILCCAVIRHSEVAMSSIRHRSLTLQRVEPVLRTVIDHFLQFWDIVRNEFDNSALPAQMRMLPLSSTLAVARILKMSQR
jgi:hypothetical protein